MSIPTHRLRAEKSRIAVMHRASGNTLVYARSQVAGAGNRPGPGAARGFPSIFTCHPPPPTEACRPPNLWRCVSRNWRSSRFRIRYPWTVWRWLGAPRPVRSIRVIAAVELSAAFRGCALSGIRIDLASADGGVSRDSGKARSDPAHRDKCGR
jgi:hypothetical protein